MTTTRTSLIIGAVTFLVTLAIVAVIGSGSLWAVFFGAMGGALVAASAVLVLQRRRR